MLEKEQIIFEINYSYDSLQKKEKYLKYVKMYKIGKIETRQL